MITAELGGLAQQMLDQRQMRNALFGEHSDAFGEPAWDMMLLMAARRGGGDTIGRDDVLAAAGVPCGTAIRYLEWLLARKLVTIVRAGDTDGSIIVALSERGRELMTNFLSRVALKQAPC